MCVTRVRCEGTLDEVGVARVDRIRLGAPLEVALVFEQPNEAIGLAVYEINAGSVVGERDARRGDALGEVKGEFRMQRLVEEVELQPLVGVVDEELLK